MATRTSGTRGTTHSQDPYHAEAAISLVGELTLVAEPAVTRSVGTNGRLAKGGHLCFHPPFEGRAVVFLSKAKQVERALVRCNPLVRVVAPVSGEAVSRMAPALPLGGSQAPRNF